MRSEQQGRTRPAADILRLRFERIYGKSVVLGVWVFASGDGANGVRVIIDGFDAGDFRGYLGVDLQIE
jgi:hypothetical protein